MSCEIENERRFNFDDDDGKMISCSYLGVSRIWRERSKDLPSSQGIAGGNQYNNSR